jgi:hypothetical protein
MGTYHLYRRSRTANLASAGERLVIRNGSGREPMGSNRNFRASAKTPKTRFDPTYSYSFSL